MIKAFTDKFKGSLYSNGAVNVVCLGDSVTQGAFENGHCDTSLAYGEKLAHLLNFYCPNRVVNVINSGIGGTTAKFATTRFERDVLAYHPDLVLVMFGVNDFSDPDAYRDSLSEIFARLNKENIPAVYITEHMMNTYVAEWTHKIHLDYAKTTSDVQNNGTMDKMFDIGREVAKEHNIPVCDMYAKWKALNEMGTDTTKFLANGINHPIPEMHTLLAYELLNTILF